ncbi:hypothetical protein EC968_004125 [Mortierella alpina]|nr:hypothetical protein EC968_004125 [Mortierella alpina]
MWALDAEWRPYVYPGKQGRMALIQLGDDKSVYLFHVFHMKKFPEALARILLDKRILKVGINIRNDGTKMLKDWGVGCASLVELGALYVQVADDLSNQRRIRSMASLTSQLLGHSVEKTLPTRMGNWENKNLSALQLQYAANDAFVTYEVAEKIKELQHSRPPKDYEIELATIHSEGTKVVKIYDDKGCQRCDHSGHPRAIDWRGSDQDYNSKQMGNSSKQGWIQSYKHDPVIIIYIEAVAVACNCIEKSSSSWPNEIQTIHRGRQTVVTIIPPKFQKRLFSQSRPAFKRSEPHADGSRAQLKKRTGDVYIPDQFLPESLENKDILERNQAVWLEAGGRGLSGEITEDYSSESDWYLQQNQTLFESLGQSSLDVEQERLKKTEKSK